MSASGRLPRVGFLGVGWIGRNRLEAALASGCIEVAAIADPSAEMVAAAAVIAPAASVVSPAEILAQDLDGLVIATPSALHAAQSIAALERGMAVFCQKPLGRSRSEVGAVVDAARKADRLLGVDMSYRHTAGMRCVRQLLEAGEFGRLFAIDLTFHNAYGPDKPWFYDPAQSGGGCLMDLGVHLVDLAVWLTGFPTVAVLSSTLYAGGELLDSESGRCEDYAAATMIVGAGVAVRLACSWRLHAGQDAAIEVALHGTEGGATFRNLGGSFYDFVAERHRGTAREILCEPPDPWGGRAIADWCVRLATGERFASDGGHWIAVADCIDRIYAAASRR